MEMNKEEYETWEKAAISRYKAMPHLKETCNSCRMCNLGWKKAKKNNKEVDPHVFSNWDPRSRPPMFMIVGQNPGWDEVQNDAPFIGASGSNFDNALKDTMHKRSDFYITNAVKCFTQGNKVPDQKSIDRCEPFLRMEIAIVKPKFVITFGKVSFNLMCPDADYNDSVAKLTNSEKFGVKVMAIYHPSPMNLSQKVRKQKFNADIKLIGRIMNTYLTPF
jgi:uracil-DNA glycosylase family 4